MCIKVRSISKKQAKYCMMGVCYFTSGRAPLAVLVVSSYCTVRSMSERYTVFR
jgi:hypothetical protein